MIGNMLLRLFGRDEKKTVDECIDIDDCVSVLKSHVFDRYDSRLMLDTLYEGDDAEVYMEQNMMFRIHFGKGFDDSVTNIYVSFNIRLMPDIVAAITVSMFTRILELSDQCDELRIDNIFDKRSPFYPICDSDGNVEEIVDGDIAVELNQENYTRYRL